MGVLYTPMLSKPWRRVMNENKNNRYLFWRLYFLQEDFSERWILLFITNPCSFLTFFLKSRKKFFDFLSKSSQKFMDKITYLLLMTKNSLT